MLVAPGLPAESSSLFEQPANARLAAVMVETVERSTKRVFSMKYAFLLVVNL